MEGVASTKLSSELKAAALAVTSTATVLREFVPVQGGDFFMLYTEDPESFKFSTYDKTHKRMIAMFLPTFYVEQCEIGLLAVSACAAGESRGVAPLVDDHVALEQLAEVRRLLALRHAHLHRLATHRVCRGTK